MAASGPFLNHSPLHNGLETLHKTLLFAVSCLRQASNDQSCRDCFPTSPFSRANSKSFFSLLYRGFTRRQIGLLICMHNFLIDWLILLGSVDRGCPADLLVVTVSIDPRRKNEPRKSRVSRGSFFFARVREHSNKRRMTSLFNHTAANSKLFCN